MSTSPTKAKVSGRRGAVVVVVVAGVVVDVVGALVLVVAAMVVVTLVLALLVDVGDAVALVDVASGSPHALAASTASTVMVSGLRCRFIRDVR